MSKQLMITADDYGVHPIINKGIEHCIDAGLIDCVDMMVTHYNSGRYIRAFVKKYKDIIENGTLKLGVHLNLTCGAPAYKGDEYYLDFIAEKRTTASGQSRWEFKYNSPQALTSRVFIMGEHYATQMRKEIDAQCQRFTDYTGRKPDHISSHAGVFQATKELYRIFADYAISEDIFFRNPTLIAFDDLVGEQWKKNPKQKLFPWLLNLTTNGIKITKWTKNGLKSHFHQDRNHDLVSTDFFVEHFYQNPSETDLRNILGKMGEHSYELVVHPVIFGDDDELENLPIGINKNAKKMRKRRIETQTLTTITDQHGNKGIKAVMKNDFGIDPFEFPENPEPLIA